MSNETQTAPEVVATVPRNEVEMPFIVGETTKGTKKGEKYRKVNWAATSFESLVKWLGVDEAFDILKGRVDNRAKGWTDEATSEDGVLNEQEWLACAIGISQRGESMADLREKLEETLMMLNDTSISDEQALAITKKARDIQVAINNKKRDRKKEEETAKAA